MTCELVRPALSLAIVLKTSSALGMITPVGNLFLAVCVVWGNATSPVASRQ
jgi:hypothetical protein